MKYLNICILIIISSCVESNQDKINVMLNNIIVSHEKQNFKSTIIGNDVWMSENLNVSHFKNGDEIMEAKTKEEWSKASENKKPVWCYYKNLITNGIKYGKLYNWYAVSDSRSLAPKGWHISTTLEWKELERNLGEFDTPGRYFSGYRFTGTKIKDSIGWELVSGCGSNESGFNAIPAGAREYNIYDGFLFIGESASSVWWTANDADLYDYAEEYESWTYSTSQYINHLKSYTSEMGNGFSVRCIED